MEPTSLTVFAGYEIAPGCKWSGVYMVWTLEEFADMDFSTKSSTVSRRSRRPHKTKVVDLPDDGICFPWKSEYDRVNYILKGLRRGTPPSALALPSVADLEGATVRVLPAGDRWARLGRHWMRVHTIFGRK